MSMNTTPIVVATRTPSRVCGRSQTAAILIAQAHDMLDAMRHDLTVDDGDCFLPPTVVGCFGTRTEGLRFTPEALSLADQHPLFTDALRFFARRGADGVMFVSDAYTLGASGERTGEMLNAYIETRLDERFNIVCLYSRSPLTFQPTKVYPGGSWRSRIFTNALPEFGQRAH